MGMDPAVKFFSDMKDRFWIKEKAAPYGGSLKLGQVWEGTDNQTRVQVGQQGIVLSVFAGPIASRPARATRPYARGVHERVEGALSRLYHAIETSSSFSDWPKSPSSRPVTRHRGWAKSSRSARSSTSRSTTGCSSPESTRRWTSSATWRVRCARENARRSC